MARKSEKTGVKSKPRRKRTTSALSARLRELITDARQLRAATVLAYCGYRKRGPKSGAVNQAARQAGVALSTIHKWLLEENFLAAIEEMKSELVLQCVGSLRLAATENRNPTAAIYLLKILRPELYDDQFIRDQAKRTHEMEMLKTRLEHGIGGDEETLPPQITFKIAHSKEDIDQEFEQ